MHLNYAADIDHPCPFPGSFAISDMYFHHLSVILQPITRGDRQRGQPAPFTPPSARTVLEINPKKSSTANAESAAQQGLVEQQFSPGQ